MVRDWKAHVCNSHFIQSLLPALYVEGVDIIKSHRNADKLFSYVRKCSFDGSCCTFSNIVYHQCRCAHSSPVFLCFVSPTYLLFFTLVRFRLLLTRVSFTAEVHHCFGASGQEVTELTIEHLQDLWLIDFLWLPVVWGNCWVSKIDLWKVNVSSRLGLGLGVEQIDRKETKEETRLLVEHNIQWHVFVVNGSGSKYAEYTCRADRAGYYRQTWAGVVESRKMYDRSLSVEVISSESFFFSGAFVCLNFSSSKRNSLHRHSSAVSCCSTAPKSAVSWLG